MRSLEKDSLKKSVFEDAAKTCSIDKKTAKNGGATGSGILSKFDPVWRSAVKKLAVNNVSSPEKLRDVWYLLKLTHKTEPRQYTFEEKKSYIINDVLYAKYRHGWETTYKKLRSEFKVKINEENLDKYFR